MRQLSCRAPLIPALAIACLLAACGGGGSSPSTTTDVVAVSPPASPPAGPPPVSPPGSPPASPAPVSPPASPPAAPPTNPPAPPPASTSSDIIWGANGHPFFSYPDVSFEQQLDTLKALGATQYRVNLKPDGSISELERLYVLAQARGITLLPIILPEFSLKDDSEQVIYQRARANAEMLAARFKGRIKVWELGNEYENHAIIQPCEMRDDGTQYPCAWGPAGGVEAHEYYGPRWKKVSAALDGMSDGIKAVDPSALRAMGTAGWGHTGAFERMKADGVEWDITVWHQYSATSGNEWAFERLVKYNKPIWITEVNHPGGSTDGEAAQSQGLTSIMAGHRAFKAKYRIEAVFFYELLDEPYWSGYEAVMGLHHVVKDNATGRWKLGAPKLAFTSVKAAIAAGGN